MVGKNLGHYQVAVVDEGRVRVTAGDAEFVDAPTVPRDVPVAEVETKQVRVRAGWDSIRGP
jgi:hypothetical protein